MPAAKEPGPTVRMMEQLLDDPDHRLAVPVAEEDSYRRLAATAKRTGKIPDGQQIRIERDWSTHTTVIVLEDQPDWKTVKLDPVPVPATLRNPSDVVTTLRGHYTHIIAASERNRALRLVEALVSEAHRRGYKAEAAWSARSEENRYSRSWDPDEGQFRISIGSDSYGLTIRQEVDSEVRTKSGRTAQRASAAYGISHLPAGCQLSSRLQIKIEGRDVPFWNSIWSERKGESLEESLPRILQELELRHEREGERRAAELQRMEDQQKRWERARERAIVDLIDAHRVQTLTKQFEDWELMRRLHAYVEALEEHIASHLVAGSEERASAEEWLIWTRAYIERLNPFTGTLAMPPDPKITDKALEPHMRGVSRYDW